MLNWIDALFFGVRRIFFDGVEQPERPAVNFTGDGVSVADDPANNRTTVTISGGGGGSDLITADEPAALPQLGFRPNGRPRVFASPSDGLAAEACDVALLSDADINKCVNKGPDADATSTFWGVICPTVDREHELQYVTITPAQDITGHASNYALIRVWTIAGFGDTPTLLASRTTQSSIQESSPLSVTLSSTTIAAGTYVYATITKVGSGVSLPAMAIAIRANVRTDYALPEEEE
jgi:hypothetical protein